MDLVNPLWSLLFIARRARFERVAFTAHNNGDRVALEQLRHATRHLVGHTRLLSKSCSLFHMSILMHVAFQEFRNPSSERIVLHAMKKVRGRDHRLRGNAADVQTNAAHVFALDDRGLFAQLRRANRRHIATRDHFRPRHTSNFSEPPYSKAPYIISSISWLGFSIRPRNDFIKFAATAPSIKR